MCATQFQQLSDNFLVIKYQEKKEVAAFEVLYQRYAEKVFYYCYKIIGNREDAQDIAMEVFEKVFENIATLKETVTFQAWLFRIARNRSINACLRQQNKYYIPIDDNYEMTYEGMDMEQQELMNAKVGLAGGYSFGHNAPAYSSMLGYRQNLLGGLGITAGFRYSDVLYKKPANAVKLAPSNGLRLELGLNWAW